MFAAHALVACLTVVSWACSHPPDGTDTRDPAVRPQDRAPSQPQAQSPEPQAELTPADAAKIPPFPPTDLEVKTTRNAATVTWEPSALQNVVGYRVYRKSGDKFVKIGETPKAMFVDKTFKPGTVYSVSAVNVYGAESPLAAPTPKAPNK
jgi:hypothetical protein